LQADGAVSRRRRYRLAASVRRDRLERRPGVPRYELPSAPTDAPSPSSSSATSAETLPGERISETLLDRGDSGVAHPLRRTMGRPTTFADGTAVPRRGITYNAPRVEGPVCYPTIPRPSTGVAAGRPSRRRRSSDSTPARNTTPSYSPPVSVRDISQRVRERTSIQRSVRSVRSPTVAVGSNVRR